MDNSDLPDCARCGGTQVRYREIAGGVRVECELCGYGSTDGVEDVGPTDIRGVDDVG